MSRPAPFERMPVTPPHRSRCPEPRIAAGARRRRLRRARRAIAAFPPANRYQAELRGVALAMIGHMNRHWCGPGRAYDFDRWWRIVDYYTRFLGSPELAAARNRTLLDKILEQNLVPPSRL